MLAVLRAVHGGVVGLVLDITGQPVAGAHVMVDGLDKVTHNKPLNWTFKFPSNTDLLYNSSSILIFLLIPLR